MTWTLTLTEVDQQSTSSSFCSDLTSEDERSGVRSECRTEQVYKSVFPYLRGQGVCWDSEHGSGGGGGAWERPPADSCPGASGSPIPSPRSRRPADRQGAWEGHGGRQSPGGCTRLGEGDLETK